MSHNEIAMSMPEAVTYCKSAGPSSESLVKSSYDESEPWAEAVTCPGGSVLRPQSCALGMCLLSVATMAQKLGRDAGSRCVHFSMRVWAVCRRLKYIIRVQKWRG